MTKEKIISSIFMLLAFSSALADDRACGSKSGYDGISSGCITNSKLLSDAGISASNLAQQLAEEFYRKQKTDMRCGFFGNGRAEWYVEEATSTYARFTVMCGGDPKADFSVTIKSRGGQLYLIVN